MCFCKKSSFIFLFIRNEANPESNKQTKNNNKTIMIEESKEGGNLMSIITKSLAEGPDGKLAKGPKDDLLL